MPGLDKYSYDTKTFGQGNTKTSKPISTRDISLYSATQPVAPKSPISVGSTVGASISKPTPSTTISFYGGDGSSASPAQETKPVDKPLSDQPNDVLNPTKPTSPATPNGAGNGNSVDSYYGGPALPEQDPNSVYLDEIQKAAAEKNYKTLLQSDIAAYNLKLQTKKYLDNELAAQGLGTQGYGTTAHVGVENSAANLYAQNLENYNEANADALSDAQQRQREEEEKAIAEAKANATEADNQLVTFLQYSDGSETSIASYMEKYGYELRDGVWVNKETGEPASAYVQAAVQSAMENGGSAQEGQSSVYFSTLEDLKAQTYQDHAGGTRTLGQSYNSEMDYLDWQAKQGNYESGTVICVKNGNGDTIYLRYESGKGFAFSNESAYKAAIEEGKGKQAEWNGKEVVETTVRSSKAQSAYSKDFLSNNKSNYSGVSSDGYDSIDALRSVKVGHKDNRQGASDTLQNIVGNELKYIEDKIKAGTVENGTLFKVQRGGGYHEAYLILYLDGKFYVVSDDDREEAQYQVSQRYNRYDGPKEEVIGK